MRESDLVYSNTAFILLIPAATDSSFVILNLPNSFVFETWGPVQISLENGFDSGPIV